MRSQISLNVYYIVLTTLTVISMVVTLKRAGETKARAFLSLMFWSYWYSIFAGLVTMSNLVDYLPHVFRTAHLTTLLFMPASYLYVRQTLYPERSLKNLDLVHLVPLMVYLVDYMPFFLLTGQQKLDILHAMDVRGLQVYMKEGWFIPIYGHVAIRYLAMLIYWTAQVYLISNTIRSTTLNVTRSNQLGKWLIWLSICQLLIILPSLYGIFLASHHDLTKAFLLQGTSLIGALMIGGYLILNPEIFYGFGSGGARANQQVDETNEDSDSSTPYSESFRPKNPLSPAATAELEKKLDELAERSPFWLNPGYRLADLARDANSTSHLVSAYLNQVKNQNFYDFINSRRVDAFVKQLGRGELKSRTLEALAKDSGFGNRVTFIRAFKKAKGVSPSVFIRKNGLN